MGAARAGRAVVRVEKAEGAAFYWHLVHAIGAYQLDGYWAPIPTLFDSTAVNPGMHYVQVIAQATDPDDSCPSAPEGGCHTVLC